MKFQKTLIAATLASFALVGCSAPKKVDSLEQARAAYTRAANDPTVARHAPKELDAAKVALGKAERSWQEKEKTRIVDRDAELASKRVRTAELIAQSREADGQVEDSKLERQRVQLDLRATEIDRAEAEAAELKRQLEELQAKQTERGMVLTLGDVLFELGKAELQPGAMRNIEQIAAFMQKYPEKNAVIEGHTDSTGDDDFNMDLSRERAYSVREALVLRGVESHRISTQGFGRSMPVASNSTRDGRQLNRRVEIIFPDLANQVSELAQ